MTDSQQPPPAEPSDEADETQLEMAKAEGEAYLKSLEYMANEVAHSGDMKRAGDYIVAFAQEEAEGMYHMRDGELEWVEPDEENCHFEVAVLDATDHRFVPYLAIELTVEDGEGNTVGTREMPFVWHPGLFHYGANWKVPGDGIYTLKIHIDAPDFMRHDETNGKRYAQAVDVEFHEVSVDTGQD